MYHTIAVINEEHHIDLVQDPDTRKIYIKKVLSVYNRSVYEHLKNNPVKGIPKIIDISESDNILTVIEEYVAGVSLRECIDNKDLNEEEIRLIISDLCDILSKLHSMDPPIVHRDIKPSNIIISPSGHIVLTDFNVAKHYSRSDADTVLLGTNGYAAPEQYGFGSSTPQSDIYSTGILLKEMCETLPKKDATFNRIIKKCTMIDPSRRYSDVGMLKHDLFVKYSRSFLPPGFRTGNFLNIAIALPVYLIIFYLCLTLKLENVVSIYQLWLTRITVLGIFLTFIGLLFNYRDVYRIFPICNSPRKLYRIIGAIFFSTCISASLFVLLLLVEVFFWGSMM